MKKLKRKATAPTFWLIFSLTALSTGCEVSVSDTPSDDVGRVPSLDAIIDEQNDGASTGSTTPDSDLDVGFVEDTGSSQPTDDGVADTERTQVSSIDTGIDERDDGDTGITETDSPDGATGGSTDGQMSRPDQPMRGDGSAPGNDAAATPPDAAVLDIEERTDAVVEAASDAGVPDADTPMVIDSSVDGGAANVDFGALDSRADDAQMADNGQYPEGPYGVAVGDVIANLSFVDSTDAPTDLETLRRDGDAGFLVLFNAVAWCGSCVRNMVTLQASQTRLADAGVRIVVSLYDNENFMPADAVDANRWQQRNNLTMPVVADGERSLAAYFDPFARNTYLVIEVDEMRIVARGQRYNSAAFNDQLDGLLDPN
ncbi:MAG: redoxin family protein [Myxococcota bacterium]|nr:redoxin family protein [Myxococcota bacterium]